MMSILTRRGPASILVPSITPDMKPAAVGCLRIDEMGCRRRCGREQRHRVPPLERVTSNCSTVQHFEPNKLARPPLVIMPRSPLELSGLDPRSRGEEQRAPDPRATQVKRVQGSGQDRYPSRYKLSRPPKGKREASDDDIINALYNGTASLSPPLNRSLSLEQDRQKLPDVCMYLHLLFSSCVHLVPTTEYLTYHVYTSHLTAAQHDR